MKNLLTNKCLVSALVLLLSFGAYGQEASIDTLYYASNAQKTLLVLTITEGFVHTDAIASGKKTLAQLGQQQQYNILHAGTGLAVDPGLFSQVDAVIFLCTTLDIFDDTQQEAFEKFIQSGGGYVGIHSAADTEYDWPWYGKLVGGYFVSHPPGTPSARIETVDTANPMTDHLPKSWQIEDEWYNYRYTTDQVNVLLYLDEQSYTGGTNGAEHPITWYHAYDGGRAFYTGLGHWEKTYGDPRFVTLLKKGIQYVLGE